MSSGVAQVKKRFGEFETYLRKDTEGLRRLKLLKDDVNVLRTSLASANAERDAAVASMEVARQRADKAEMLAVDISDDNRRLRDQNISMRSQIEAMRRLQSSNDDSEHADDGDSGNEYAQVSSVMKRLRQLIPTCPEMSDAFDAFNRDPDTPLFVFREDLAKGWAYNDIWCVGAVAAMLSAMNGSVIIVAKRKLSDIVPPITSANPDGNGVGRKFTKWFRHRIDWRTSYEQDKQKLAKLLSRGRWADAGTSEQTAEGLGL